MRTLLFLLLLTMSCDGGQNPSKNNNSEASPVNSDASVKDEILSRIENEDPTLEGNLPFDHESGKILPHAEIDIYEMNKLFLAKLVEVKINKLRTSRGLSPFYSDSKLEAAAQDQNRYQIATDDLTHHQVTRGKENVRDRVQYYDGSFRAVGENVQFHGFLLYSGYSGKRIQAGTYEDTAEKVVENWKNSPGHYRNIINEDYKYSGIVVDLNHDGSGLYATQVFAG